MPDDDRKLLAGILEVLERIDTKIALQDDQLQKLNALISSRDEFQLTSRSNTITDSTDITEPKQRSEPFGPLRRRSTKKKAKISYRDWNLNDLRGHLDDEFSVYLQRRLGDWGKIPRDNRLPLYFSIYGRDSSVVFNRLDPYAVATTASSYTTQWLKAAYDFDAEHRRFPGNDFLVVDFDSQNNHIIYRLGETALGNDLLVDDTEDTFSAPWSRLMYARFFPILRMKD